MGSIAWKALALGAGLLLTLGTWVSPAAAKGDGKDGGHGKKVTFLTRNLYLGADLGPAIEAVMGGDPAEILPAVGEMWAKVQATDFPTRAVALAEEIKESKPDVVGLQECVVWSTGTAFDPAPADTVEYDFLQILLDALEDRGAHYVVVGTTEGYVAEIPGFVATPPFVRDISLRDRDVLLVRKEHGIKVSNAAAVNFTVNLELPFPGGTFTATRGWVQADVATGHERFRVVTTHFENEHPGVRLAQAAEVLAVPCDTTLATVVLGDFNSDGNGVASPAAYDLFRDAGFGDAWVDDHPDDDGITWGHDELLVDPVPFSTDVLDEIGRIDFVLYRGDVSTVESDRLGEVEEDMFDGLWPSDHAGVTATLRIR